MHQVDSIDPSPLVVAFSPTGLDDASQIAEMAADLIEVGLTHRSWTPRRVISHIRSRSTLALSATVDQRLIAFGIAEMHDKTAHLDLIAVAPSHQRCGVGRALIEQLEEHARSVGASEMRLELRISNAVALAFYKRLGYRECGRCERYYCATETAIQLKRLL